MAVVMDAEALEAFMREVFDQVADDFAVDHVAENEITMRLLTSRRHLRPGGTVSGPSMFALADVAAYLATLAMIGFDIAIISYALTGQIIPGIL